MFGIGKVDYYETEDAAGMPITGWSLEVSDVPPTAASVEASEVPLQRPDGSVVGFVVPADYREFYVRRKFSGLDMGGHIAVGVGVGALVGALGVWALKR